MPELPEVETVVRTLAPGLTGAVVQAVDVLSATSIEPATPESFSACLAGRVFVALSRRGKFIVCHLDSGYLLAHLRMTGQLLLRSDGDEQPRFARVVLHLDQDRRLWFSDMRKFGRLTLTDDPGSLLARLGPEPFDAALDAVTFHGLLQRHRRPLKPLLLDQEVLAGLGNIYADEALFAARLHPSTPANTLTVGQAACLLAAIRDVLTNAICNRGTTISDYVDADGRAGEHQSCLKVYGRAGMTCPVCQASIESARLAGRSSCFCPRCQPRVTRDS